MENSIPQENKAGSPGTSAPAGDEDREMVEVTKIDVKNEDAILRERIVDYWTAISEWSVY